MPTGSEWYHDEDELSREARVHHRMIRALPDIEGYEDLQPLGRGGQGIVLRAVQRSTRRVVAIKVLLEGAFASEVARGRFEREMDLIAEQRHPNIVHVYDRGMTASGLPYFVMEYIDGLPFDDWAAALFGRDRPDAASAKAPPREPAGQVLLRTFARVCDAVNHAHQRGVIHRDLKPSNLRIDPDGEPHVLDFGLAKIRRTGLDAQQEPTITRHGQFAGSLPWASPEQAEGGLHSIDVRSDVYALGVILFQALTGRFPYHVSGSLREALNSILDAQPVRPSTIDRTISEDLEAIVLTCLAKDPERRYQTAADLARDLRRHLAGEPIEARRESAWPTLRRTLWRYRMGTSAAILIVCALSLLYWQARLQSHRARQEAEKAGHVRRFLEDVLLEAEPGRSGFRVSLAEVLDKVGPQIAMEFGDYPEIEASLEYTLGVAYANLGLRTMAREHLARCVALRSECLGDEHPETLAARTLHMNLQPANPKNLQKAEAHHRFMHDLCRRTLGDRHVRTVSAALTVVSTLEALDRWDEADALRRDAIANAQPLLDADDELAFAAMHSSVLGLRDRGRLADAQAQAEALLARFADHPDPEYRYKLGAQELLGEIQLERGEFPPAEALLGHLLEVKTRLLGDAHPATLETALLLGKLRQLRGRIDEAETLAARTMDLARDALGAEAPATLRAARVLAQAYLAQERLEEAQRLLEQTLETYRAFWGAGHSQTACTEAELVDVYFVQGRHADAEIILHRLVAWGRAFLGPDHYVFGDLLTREGECLMRLKRYDDAQAALLDGRRALAAVLPADHPQVVRNRNALSTLQEHRTGNLLSSGGD